MSLSAHAKLPLQALSYSSYHSRNHSHNHDACATASFLSIFFFLFDHIILLLKYVQKMYCSSESLLRLVNIKLFQNTKSSFKGKTCTCMFFLIMQFILFFCKRKKFPLTLCPSKCFNIHLSVCVDGCCPTILSSTKIENLNTG